MADFARAPTRRWGLSDLALDRPVTIGMALVALLVIGALAIVSLPLAFLPSGTSARISVRVDITRTSPESLEREVIRPLEEEVSGIKDLKLMRVTSGSWGVRMHLEMQPGSDLDARKLELRERLERARGQLPETVQRIEISSSSGMEDSPMMRLRIASDRDLSRDYALIEQNLVRRLERIDGVASVTMSGIQPHEIEVAVDAEAARRQGVSLADVAASVRQAQRAVSMGELRGPASSVGVRRPAEPADAQRFAAIPIARGTRGNAEPAASAAASGDPTRLVDPTRPPVAGDPTLPPGAVATVSTSAIVVDTTVGERGFARVGEVARVSRHPVEERSGSRLNGRDAINVEIFAEAGASLVTVAHAVRATLDELRTDPKLGNLEITVFEDQGREIVKTLTDLRNTGVYGGLIAFLVLLAFLKRLRPTLVAAACIPLSLIGACAVLFLRGDELNCIVMLGLVIGVGMVVDNAVVIVESIQREAANGADARTAARVGARRVGVATIASTLSSVIVFLPLVIGSGSNPMSVYFEPLGTTFVIALLASLFVSQCAVPLVLGSIGTAASRAARSPLLDAASALYARMVRASLRRPRLIALAGLLVSLTCAWPLMNARVKFSGFDQAGEGIPIDLELLAGRDYLRSLEHVKVLEGALLPRKDALGIGTLSCSYRDWGGNCDVRPSRSFQSEGEKRAFQRALTEALPPQSGVRYRVDERERWRRQNNDPQDVEFALKGEDMGVLIGLSERVAEHLARVLPKGDVNRPDDPGYDQIYGPFNEGALELHVVLDPERLVSLGLRAADVADQVSLAFQGAPLGQVSGADGQIALRLSAGSLRSLGNASLQDLHELRIPLPNGQDVALAGIADIRQERAPWWLQRVNRETEVRIRVRFFSKDGEANKAAVQTALASFRFPDGYSSGEGTQWWRDPAGEMEMFINLGLCLLLVYAVMASLFESFLQPLSILVTGLLGCVGAPWALWLTDTTIDTVAIIGLFILIGIVVNNGIMLVDAATQHRAAGVSRTDALARAGQERLRPIVMTATTTVLGLVPMLVHHPTLAGVYYHAIAIVIAGGLVTSTLMTLVVLPAAYCILEDTSVVASRVWRRVSGAAATASATRPPRQ